jgi:hypothetical protein
MTSITTAIIRDPRILWTAKCLLLYMIDAGTPISIAHASRDINIPHRTLIASLQSLVAFRLIERQPAPLDRADHARILFSPVPDLAANLYWEPGQHAK